MTFYPIRVAGHVSALNAGDTLTIYTPEGAALFDLRGSDVAAFLDLLHRTHRHMEKTEFGGEERYALLDRIIVQGKSVPPQSPNRSAEDAQP